MADWTTPKTWNVGDVLTASDMNTYVRDNTRIEYRKVTTKTVSATTTETDLLNGEITVAAGVMGSNQRLRLTMQGEAKNNKGSDETAPRFKFKMGGTTILDTGVGANDNLSNSATAGIWEVEIEVRNKAATNAQSVLVKGYLIDGSQINWTSGAGVYNGNTARRIIFGRTTSTIDTTTSKLVEWTVINGSNNANVYTSLTEAEVVID